MRSVEDDTDEIIRLGEEELGTEYKNAIHAYKHFAIAYFNKLEIDSDFREFVFQLGALYNSVNHDAEKVADLKRFFSDFLKLVTHFFSGSEIPQNFVKYLGVTFYFYEQKLSGKKAQIAFEVLQDVLLERIKFVGETPSIILMGYTEDSIISNAQLQHLRSALEPHLSNMENAAIACIKENFGEQRYDLVHRRLFYDILRYSAIAMDNETLKNLLAKANKLMQEVMSLEYRQKRIQSFESTSGFLDTYYKKCMFLFIDFIAVRATKQMLEENFSEYTDSFGKTANAVLFVFLKNPVQPLKDIIDAQWEESKKVLQTSELTLEQRFKLLQFFLIEFIYNFALFHYGKLYQRTQHLIGDE